MSDEASKPPAEGADPLQQPSVFGTRGSANDLSVRVQAEAIEAGKQIAQQCSDLDRPARLRIAAIFRRQLIPPRTPGKKRRKEITAAHADWKLGIRGKELYCRHIPGFDRMGRWRREAKSRDLMDAIRSRERRATKQQPVA
jgi:hypothetical protein